MTCAGATQAQSAAGAALWGQVNQLLLRGQPLRMGDQVKLVGSHIHVHPAPRTWHALAAHDFCPRTRGKSTVR